MSLSPADTASTNTEKGTVPICAQHPPGRSGKWGLSPFPCSPLRAVLKSVGSLWLTVGILIVLIAVLLWGTVVEKYYGDMAAKFGIYGAWWFNLLGLVLGLNSAAALALRWPWKRQHLGFILPHVGLIVLLVGCLVSRRWGIEATLTVIEGQSSNRAYQGVAQHVELDGAQRFRMQVISSDSTDAGALMIDVPFTSGPFNWEDYGNGTLSRVPWAWAHRDHGIVYDRDGIRLEVLDYMSNSEMVDLPTLTVEATPLLHAGGEPKVCKLTVKPGDAMHGLQATYGLGAEEQSPDGTRILFWMTGNEDETAALRQSAPTGPLGKKGRAVLFAQGHVYDWALDDWQPGSRRKLGDSGLEAELVGLVKNQDDVLAKFDIHKGSSIQRLVLSSEFPELLNQQDYVDAVFGSYWLARPAGKDEGERMKDEGRNSAFILSPSSFLSPVPPRVDFFQGADHQLYLRTWQAGAVKVVGPLKMKDGGGRITAFHGTHDALALKFSDFLPADQPTASARPLPFNKDNDAYRLRQAFVRLTVDGRSDEFWMPCSSCDPMEIRALAVPKRRFKHTVEGGVPGGAPSTLGRGRRRVQLAFEPQSFELGFSVKLRKAWRKLDPGTHQASFYASEIDLVPEEGSREQGAGSRTSGSLLPAPGSPPPPKYENLLVTLNAPLDFTDPRSGKSFRMFQSRMSSPYQPQDLGIKLGEPVYVSGLSLNDDPGRGLTYVGCLLIVAGIFVAYFVKLTASKASRNGLVVLLCTLLFASPARAEDSGGLDWSAWQRMPVLQDGRIMPLDSFARTQVKTICGDANPLIGRLGLLSKEEMKSLSAEQLQQRAKDNRPRRFLAAELLYSWTVSPAPWEDVPFLYAANAELRSEVLGLPLEGEDGSRLTQVSPRQVRASTKLVKLVADVANREVEAQQKKQRPNLSALDQSAKELSEALAQFDRLSFDPAGGDGRRWLEGDVAGLVETWGQFNAVLPQLPVFEPNPEMILLTRQTDEAVRNLADAFRPMQTKLPGIDRSDADAAQLRRLADKLAAEVDKFAKTEVPDSAGLSQSDAEEIVGNRQIVARWANSIALQVAKIQWGLYDAEGEALFVLPALEPTALEADRHRSEIHPWISLHALLEGSLQGSSALLQGYPPEEVRQVRAAWDTARTAYLDRAAKDRREDFSAAMQRFTGGIRTISKEIEPRRQELPIIERDKGLLAKTAYPRAIVTDAEVQYNRLDPFRLAWCMSLAAAGILALSYLGKKRVFRVFFWLGVFSLIASVAVLAGGFGVRIYITHWAPVTSMFETIVWVAMCVALLLLWVTFLPLLGPACKTAWSWTALKKGSELFSGVDVPARAIALTSRLALFLAGLYIVGVIPALGHLFKHASPGDAAYGGQEYSLVSFLPRVDIGSTLPGASSTLVWLTSLFVAGALTWYLPRLIPAAVMGIAISVAGAFRADSAEKLQRIYSCRIVALAGALASFCAALAANVAPFPRDIQALMPVLRSNFWLGIHVLTITTSYAGAAAAWMIGNLALGFYVFGRYTRAGSREQGAGSGEYAIPTPCSELPAPSFVPPAFCAVLANLNYRVIQVTVLLLAAGTILGGLWADVSWGRFWGWDPKEVGALIALLLLLTALHGRRAGWSGDLTLAIGSIMGFFGVLWAWYVVNFLLNAGLHSYGAGEGGQWVWLVVVVSAQFLFILAAVVRVLVETGRVER